MKSLIHKICFLLIISHVILGNNCKIRNLITEDYNQILYESSNTYYSDVIRIDENNFVVCGNKIILYTKSSNTYLESVLESGLPARSCYAISEDEFVVSYQGTTYVDSFKNKIFKKDYSGTFQTDNVWFSRTDTGFATKIFSLDQNKEFILFSGSYIQDGSNTPSRIMIYKRVNGIFNYYDQVYIGLHDRGCTYFRNKYVIQAKAENRTIYVFSLTNDYKISVNLPHQTLITTSQVTSILAFDDNILIVGFNDSTLKIFTFINNQFSETDTIPTSYNQDINKLSKINSYKFAVTYYVYNQVSAGTIIYIREENSYSFSIHKEIPSLYQNINNSIFLDENLLITTYNTRLYVYKMSCPFAQMSVFEGNCLYCQLGMVMEDNVCKSKCFSINNKPNIFGLCENCGTEFNGGSLYNKLDILSNSCVASCPVNLVTTSITVSSFVCLCPSNYVFKNGACVNVSNQVNDLCGKGGYIENNSICKYCPSNSQEESENKIYFLKSNNSCVNSCSFPYVKNESIQNQFYCELCSESQKFYSQQTCVEICPNKFKKYTLQGVLIWECVKECGISNLINSNGECIECPDNKKYIALNQGKEECYASCPKNYTVDETTKRCTSCENNYVVINNVCTNCLKNKDKKTISYNNECIEKCPDNLQYDQNSNTCIEKEEEITIYSNKPNCPLFITLLDNGFMCTDKCYNENGFFISIDDAKLCVKCEKENQFIKNDRCVKKCGFNEDIDYDFISDKKFEDFKCKSCKDLKIKKNHSNGICVEKCPENSIEVNNECIKSINTYIFTCEDFCFNNGLCKYVNTNPICDCSNTEYIGERCEIDYQMLDYYTDYVKEMLIGEDYEKVLLNIINIPQLSTPNLKQLVFKEMNKILGLPIETIKKNKKDIYKLIDVFNIVSNK